MSATIAVLLYLLGMVVMAEVASEWEKEQRGKCNRATRPISIILWPLIAVVGLFCKIK